MYRANILKSYILISNILIINIEINKFAKRKERNHQETRQMKDSNKPKNKELLLFL